MERMIFQADEALLERVRERARERGVSAAQVVRDALRDEVGEDQAPPPLTCVGAIRSGRSDLARHVEDHYEPPPWR